MRRPSGFTLIELMVVIAILGILTATAFPTYHAFRSRAVGAEAKQLADQIVDAEIMYYLENETFYPPNPGDLKTVDHDLQADQQEIKDELHIFIPTGHLLQVRIHNTTVGDAQECTITVQSTAAAGGQFPLFKGGYIGLQRIVDKSGSTTVALIPAP